MLHKVIASSPLLIPEIIKGFFAFFNVSAIFSASLLYILYFMFCSRAFIVNASGNCKTKICQMHQEIHETSLLQFHQENRQMRLTINKGLLSSCASSLTGASFHNGIPFSFACFVRDISNCLSQSKCNHRCSISQIFSKDQYCISLFNLFQGKESLHRFPAGTLITVPVN